MCKEDRLVIGRYLLEALSKPAANSPPSSPLRGRSPLNGGSIRSRSFFGSIYNTLSRDKFSLWRYASVVLLFVICIVLCYQTKAKVGLQKALSEAMFREDDLAEVLHGLHVSYTEVSPETGRRPLDAKGIAESAKHLFLELRKSKEEAEQERVYAKNLQQEADRLKEEMEKELERLRSTVEYRNSLEAQRESEHSKRAFATVDRLMKEKEELENELLRSFDELRRFRKQSQKEIAKLETRLKAVDAALNNRKPPPKQELVDPLLLEVTLERPPP
mmetsp:Transcript_44828/g.73001  ORF Transcript_44828/g.73001 Transcript_44828/m.73001 type:complete len:274 (+) Transcript_44828:371-1192(+)